MTPEDANRIVAAIDRNTEAIERQTVWLAEMDLSLEVLQNIRNWLKAIWLVIVIMAILWMFITPAKATPLLPPLDQPVIVEIGTPPLPPANPHVQYWHTQWVPGPGGVLPVEVFAPRLVAQVASDAVDVVDVPEPTTLDMVISFVIGIPIGWVTYSWLRKRKQSCQCISGVIVPDLAFFESMSGKTFIVKCSTCGRRSEMTGSEIQAQKALEEKP